MPAPNCNPGNVTWSGTEDGHGEDSNNALGAFKEALEKAEKTGKALVDKFEAQDCLKDCSWKSIVRAEPVITIPKPIARQPVKKKGLVFVCDLTLDWSSTIYCYKTKDEKQAANEAREKEKREKEKAAKAGP